MLRHQNRPALPRYPAPADVLQRPSQLPIGGSQPKHPSSSPSIALSQRNPLRERKGPGQRESEGPWAADEGPRPKRLLILGGTAEAAALARCVVAEFGSRGDVITSLAGRLPSRPDLPGRLRVGGFGGTAGLADYLRAERIDAVVDATHPFAAAISRNAAQACAELGVPRLMLLRPEWHPEPADRWLGVGSLAEAAALLPTIAGRAFLTTGPGGIEAFAHSDCRFLVRLFAPPSAPLPLREHEIIVARPPFTCEHERELMLRYRVEALVTKNSGGPTEAKLTAARDLGVPVVMIRRPPLPSEHSEHTVDSVEAAADWVVGRL
jgi:precorrin-6A/cobalt-precorrin-6A reductase